MFSIIGQHPFPCLGISFSYTNLITSSNSWSSSCVLSWTCLITILANSLSTRSFMNLFRFFILYP
ncbi:hypothetical protein E2C01_059304 [Portunus trituberculatus]|uniref:Uncharacterized protein n=1 Tax=Portunus trituberculatus TaxID=210409 RepID=A0A5B7H4Z6_PORTR|nr:hypothetical protein [Portunus trituberculatus]